MQTSQVRAIALIALPMILSNITVPLLGLVDTAVIGHLEHAYYLGGVALGSMIVTLIFWLCGFLRMSTTGLAAQAAGKQSKQLLIQVALNSGLFALSLGLTLVVLQTPLLEASLALAGASDEVEHYASVYFQIRIWGAPAALLNMVVLGWLLGMQNAKAPMWLLIITNAINIVLDILLVLGLGMNVDGAALATVIADYSGLLIGLAICFKVASARWGKLPSWRECRDLIQAKALLALLSLNRDIFFRSLALQLCFAFITFQGASLGDNIVAANAVLLNFSLFVSFALDGLAYAIEALSGKAKGTNQRAEFELINRTSLQLAGGFALLFSLLFWLLGPSIIGLLTGIESIQLTALNYLPWVILLPLVSVWCYVFDGIYIAMADGRAMRNSMLFASLVVFFPVWWLCQAWGNHALWLAFSAFMAARGLSLAWDYRRALASGRWFSQA